VRKIILIIETVFDYKTYISSNCETMHYFKIILLLIVCQQSFSQSLIKGKVVAQGDKTPIAYANIGIINSEIGTISNIDGSFSLHIVKGHENDEIFFSALGYAGKSIPLRSFESGLDKTVYLLEKSTILDSVIIFGKREANKLYEFGNQDSRGGVFATDTVYAGASKAILIGNEIPLKNKGFAFPVYLENAKLKIYKNNFPKFKFRVRFYEVDSLNGGQPGNDLGNESIIVESSIKKGWLVIDLAYLKFVVTKPFFVAFEPILEEKDRNAIVQEFREFKASHPKRVKIDTVIVNGEQVIRELVNWPDFPGTGVCITTTDFGRQHFVCYSRSSSFSEWKKVRGTLTATVTLSNNSTVGATPKKK